MAREIDASCFMWVIDQQKLLILIDKTTPL